MLLLFPFPLFFRAPEILLKTLPWNRLSAVLSASVVSKSQQPYVATGLASKIQCRLWFCWPRSPDIIRVIESRYMRLVGYLVSFGGIKHVGRSPDEKGSVYRKQDNSKLDPWRWNVQNVGWTQRVCCPVAMACGPLGAWNFLFSWAVARLLNYKE
jgi:hypothetical protein